VRVLVTGTKGYLGCPGAPTLFEDGHDVVGDEGPFLRGELQ
jgi:nucleoside-diphosphate-sugar epimerase